MITGNWGQNFQDQINSLRVIRPETKCIGTKELRRAKLGHRFTLPLPLFYYLSLLHLYASFHLTFFGRNPPGEWEA